MKLNRWNYGSRKYDVVEVPDGKYLTYCNNMDEIVNCPHCQKEFRFGDGYTSHEFQTECGFGYCVCKDCYENIESPIYRKFLNK